jgi:hypothetical protein
MLAIASSHHNGFRNNPSATHLHDASTSFEFSAKQDKGVRCQNVQEEKESRNELHCFLVARVFQNSNSFLLLLVLINPQAFRLVSLLMLEFRCGHANDPVTHFFIRTQRSVSSYRQFFVTQPDSIKQSRVFNKKASCIFRILGTRLLVSPTFKRHTHRLYQFRSPPAFWSFTVSR